MPARLATYTIHSLTYYKSLLLTLAKCLVAGFTHKEIAHHLNGVGILSPTGRHFTAEIVKNTLASLRKPLRFPSIAYQAMMKLIFDRELTKEQCLPLLSSAEVQL